MRHFFDYFKTDQTKCTSFSISQLLLYVQAGSTPTLVFEDIISLGLTKTERDQYGNIAASLFPL